MSLQSGKKKDRISAALLALLLHPFGAQKFYLGENSKGILHILFCWTGIPTILNIIEGIKFLTMSDEEFKSKYVH